MLNVSYSSIAFRLIRWFGALAVPLKANAVKENIQAYLSFNHFK
jgi:hypothetical protein